MEYRYLSIWEETGRVDDKLITVICFVSCLKKKKPQQDAFKAKGKWHALKDRTLIFF